MKHRQDKDFRGGGHPQSKLLRGTSGTEKSEIKTLRQFVPSIITRKISGFTMMEILISCVVIGVLAVLLIPTLQSAKPDKNEALHKKSTFIVERVVNELSSDSYLYPNNGEYSSLSNTDNVQYNDETHGGNTKFCTLFASRLKLKPGSEINCKKDELSFTSEDGIDWYLPVSDFKDGAETLTVDVNGSEGPNLVGEDRFEYKIQPGFKIPKKEIDKTTITDTPEAPRKESPTGGQTVNPETKPSQPKYTISCEVTGGEAGILGAGGNKVNGNYTLVAVPEPGYKCNWFTKQVTVKGADVTDCKLMCEPDTLRPAAEGETNISEIPSGDDDDDDDDDDDEPKEEETYCARVSWGGSSEYCSDSGKVCGKAGDVYSITIKSNDKNYTAVWTQGKGSGTFGNSNVVLSASCDPKNQCYDLNITGDANCPFVLPAANCPYPGQETKYTAGTYNVTVTPKEGYTFNGKEGTVSYPVTINGTNSKIDLSSLCKQQETEKEIILTPHKDGDKLYVTPSEVVPFPMDVELGYETGEGTGNNWGFTINSNQNKSDEVTDEEFGDASCLCREDWILLNPSSTYTYDGITYTIRIENTPEPTCSTCGGGGGGTGKIKVTLEADGSNCTHGTYTDIMKAVINANGNNKNYTGTIQGNPGASTTITVPAGNYVLTNTEFDPTLSCQMADCSIYDEIKVISLTPSSVKVEKDKTAEAILKVGCTGDGKKYCIVTLVADEGGTVNPPIPQEVRCNDKMVIAATPDEDYQFSGWTIEVGEAKFDETSTVGATYIIPATDVTARASFKPAEKCSITVIGSKPDSALLGRPNDSIQVRVSGNGVNKSATLDSSNNFTYKFSGLNCGSVYTVVPTPPSYNSSTISSASYKVSGFRYGTLNGDETSTLSLNVIKLAYLYAGIGQGGGIIGEYWDWRVEAFTSNDGSKNAGWPFGDDVSSMSVSITCPMQDTTDYYGNTIPTDYTFTLTKHNFHWSSPPYQSLHPPTHCTIVDYTHFDNYVIRFLN